MRLLTTERGNERIQHLTSDRQSRPQNERSLLCAVVCPYGVKDMACSTHQYALEIQLAIRNTISRARFIPNVYFHQQ